MKRETTVVTDAEGRAMVLPRQFVERARQRAAADFFRDPGLPEDVQKDLLEGWDVYQERVRVREEAGSPLPPGGCLTLGESSVLAQCLADFHMALAEILGVPTEAVKLRIDGGGPVAPNVIQSAKRKVIADVELPEDWPRGTTHEGQFNRMDAEFKKFVQLYLDDLVTRLNQKLWADAKERLATVRLVRSELIPA